DAGFHGIASIDYLFGTRKILRVCDLDVVWIAGNHGHPEAGPFCDLCIISELPAHVAGAHMRREYLSEPETLRRLRSKESSAVLCGQYVLTIGCPLDGVGD